MFLLRAMFLRSGKRRVSKRFSIRESVSISQFLLVTGSDAFGVGEGYLSSHSIADILASHKFIALILGACNFSSPIIVVFVVIVNISLQHLRQVCVISIMFSHMITIKIN